MAVKRFSACLVFASSFLVLLLLKASDQKSPSDDQILVLRAALTDFFL